MKCKACKKRFKEDINKHYVAIDDKEFLSLNPSRRYDAVDCPKCGCQNLLGIRLGEYHEITRPSDKMSGKN